MRARFTWLRLNACSSKRTASSSPERPSARDHRDHEQRGEAVGAQQRDLGGVGGRVGDEDLHGLLREQHVLRRGQPAELDRACRRRPASPASRARSTRRAAAGPSVESASSSAPSSSAIGRHAAVARWWVSSAREPRAHLLQPPIAAVAQRHHAGRPRDAAASCLRRRRAASSPRRRPRRAAGARAGSPGRRSRRGRRRSRSSAAVSMPSAQTTAPVPRAKRTKASISAALAGSLSTSATSERSSLMMSGCTRMTCWRPA